MIVRDRCHKAGNHTTGDIVAMSENIPGDRVLAIRTSKMFYLARAHVSKNRIMSVDDQVFPEVVRD